MKEPLGMMLDITPPTVSIPKDKGVESMINKESVYLDSSPQIIPP